MTTLVARDDGVLEAATVALAPLPLPNAIARILALVYGVVMLGSFVPHVAWLAFGRYRWRRVVEGPAALRVLPTVAIVALAAGLGAWATSDPTALGAPSPRAAFLFVASSAFPLATAGFAAVLVARFRLLARGTRVHLVAVLAALVGGCVHLARFGLLFVRPWE